VSAPAGSPGPVPDPAAAHPLVGTWELAMRTPIGTMHATVAFLDADGTLTGTARGTDETVPLRDVRAAPVDAGLRVTWSQTITAPLRLHLDFDVVVEGDRMAGRSRAGRLPGTAVTGTRVAATRVAAR
jgi:hypothetical protein